MYAPPAMERACFFGASGVRRSLAAVIAAFYGWAVSGCVRVEVPVLPLEPSGIYVPENGYLRVRTADSLTFWVKEFERTDDAMLITECEPVPPKQLFESSAESREWGEVVEPVQFPYAVQWSSIASVDRIETHVSGKRILVYGAAGLALTAIIFWTITLASSEGMQE